MKVDRNNVLTYGCQRMEIEISEVAYACLDEEWNLKDMRSSFTRIYLPIEGEGTLIFGDREVQMLPHNIYVIPAGVKFSSRCEGTMKKIYVHLTVIHPDCSEVLSSKGDCITIVDSLGRIREIVDLYNENTVESVMRFKRIMYEILSDCLTWYPTSGRKLKVHSRVTRDALDYIERNVSASMTVDDICQALFVPKSTLQRRFKADTGRSVGKYLDECLDRAAESALLDPTVTVGEISDRLGFCDQFYFSRRFKKTHGVTPRVFRKKHNIK